MKTRTIALLCWMLAAANSPAALEYSVYFIANPFNNGSNSLDTVLGNLPVGSTVSFWNCSNDNPTNSLISLYASNSSYNTYLRDNDPNGTGQTALWYELDDSTPAPTNGTALVPGRGVLVYYNGQPIDLSGPTNFSSFFFQGTPNVPVLPAVLPCGFGHYNLLGRQTNDVGTYENVTGYTPLEGAQVIRFNSGSTNLNFTTYIYSSGAWTPSTPILALGEAAFFLVPPNYSFSATTHTMTITWSCGAVLQQADQPNGPWTNVSGGAVSPCSVPADAQTRFFRLKSN